RRGSRNFIGLRTICRKALFGAGFLDMLLFVLHHLGDPLEVEFVKPASFANSFLPHVFGVPKWFLQITALQKPTPVHYSGTIVQKHSRARYNLVVCPVYNVTEQRPSFSLWAGWIRV